MGYALATGTLLAGREHLRQVLADAKSYGRRPSSFASFKKVVATVREEPAKYWSWREELNLQPVVYKTTALPLSYASPP